METELKDEMTEDEKLFHEEWRNEEQEEQETAIPFGKDTENSPTSLECFMPI